ncbi:MAG: hypothetical protein ACOCP8_10420 [archaeon]
MMENIVWFNKDNLRPYYKDVEPEGIIISFINGFICVGEILGERLTDYNWVKIGVDSNNGKLFIKPESNKKEGCFLYDDNNFIKSEAIIEKINCIAEGSENNRYEEMYKAHWDDKNNMIVSNLKKPLYIDEDLEEVKKILFQKCKKGDLGAIKLFLELKGKYTKKTEVIINK